MTFHLARLLVVMPILGSIVLMSPASGGIPAAMPYGQAGCPSKFDYLVLASFADSSNLLAMTAYRAPKQKSQAD
jgi:hypothetical protein